MILDTTSYWEAITYCLNMLCPIENSSHKPMTVLQENQNLFNWLSGIMYIYHLEKNVKKQKEISITRELGQFDSITQAIREAGYSYEYPILISRIVEANKIVSNELQIPIASPVYEYKKLRIVENRPRAIEHIFIDARNVEGIEKEDLRNQSLYEFLYAHFGLKVAKNEEEILVVRADEEESELLKIEANAEVMLIKGKSYMTKYKQPFEYFQITAIPGFFRYRSVNRK